MAVFAETYRDISGENKKKYFFVRFDVIDVMP
jgi:hypothetical protein